MSAVDAITKLVEYDRKSFESFERGIKRLGWAEATKDRGTGHNSMKDTLVHILNVHEAWLVAGAQGKWDIFKDTSRRRGNICSWSDLRRYKERVWKGIDELMVGLTDKQLKRPVKVPWIKGHYTLEDGFYQTSFEQAHHLGEIIGAYWQMDKKPPQMMWIPITRGINVPVA